MHAVNAAAPKCQRCGRAVRRVFSPVGIIFKGPGFHINDYRKTPAPSDGESKNSEKKSDTKTAAAKTDGDGGTAGTAAASGAAAGKTASKSSSRSRGGGSKA